MKPAGTSKALNQNGPAIYFKRPAIPLGHSKYVNNIECPSLLIINMNNRQKPGFWSASVNASLRIIASSGIGRKSYLASILTLPL